MLRFISLAAVVGTVVAAGLSSQAPGGDSPTPEQRGPVRLVAAKSSASAAPELPQCPADMQLVEGEFCPEVTQRCVRYVDPPARGEQAQPDAEPSKQYRRCAEYAQPAVCKSNYRVSMKFCMDRYEYAEPGEQRPANFKSFTDAKRICASQGKRTCSESEWTFACEGEELRPYPYGFKRDAEACNADHYDIVDTQRGVLYDLRAERGSHPACSSPFGVMDMAGNVEEFVAIDGTRNQRPAMKGAYWQPGRNSCRAAQTAHDSYYNGMETGFRCCDAAREP